MSDDTQAAIEFIDAVEREAARQGSRDPAGWTPELQLAYYSAKYWLGDYGESVKLASVEGMERTEAAAASALEIVLRAMSKEGREPN
jgi:hypothetical protein